MQEYKILQEAFKEYGHYGTLDHAEELVLLFSSDPNKLLILREHGFIAAMVTTESIYHPGILTAIEVAWYVKPEHRKSGLGKELYAQFEDWAKLKGAKRILQGKKTPGAKKVAEVYLRKLD